MKKLDKILNELDNLEDYILNIYIFENENDVENLNLKICDLKNLVEDAKDELYDIKNILKKL